ncbi:MAG TPA: hypothetical protein VG943_12850 [Caulobacterales bacterium]|nr:hypothetical protein [Caulobacterales bacterium]
MAALLVIPVFCGVVAIVVMTFRAARSTRPLGWFDRTALVSFVAVSFACCVAISIPALSQIWQAGHELLFNGGNKVSWNYVEGARGRPEGVGVQTDEIAFAFVCTDPGDVPEHRIAETVVSKRGPLATRPLTMFTMETVHGTKAMDGWSCDPSSTTCTTDSDARFSYYMALVRADTVHAATLSFPLADGHVARVHISVDELRPLYERLEARCQG